MKDVLRSGSRPAEDLWGKKMRTTRLKILLTAAVIVLVGAVIGLIVTLSHKDKPGQEKGTALPEVPEGSVLVWLRTAEYSQENGGKTICTAQYTYDMCGRCMRKVKYGEEDEEDEDDEVTWVEYDDATHQTTETHLDRIADYPVKYCTLYTADGQTINSCRWEYRDLEYVKSYETLYEPDAEGRYESIATVSYHRGKVDRVEWWEYDKALRTQFRKAADFYLGEDLTERDDWTTIKEAAERSGRPTYAEEYDEQGRPVRVYYIDSDGTIREESFTEYYDDGVKRYHNYSNGTCRIICSDEQGRMLRITVLDEETGVQTSVTEYEYEELPSGGFREIRRKSDESGTKVHFTIRDEDGGLVREGEMIDGQEVVERLVTSDAEGRVIRNDWPMSNLSVEYEYDEYGHMIKITKNFQGEVTVETTEYTPIVLEKDKVAYAESFYDPYRIDEQ